jgi:hypothetical protein
MLEKFHFNNEKKEVNVVPFTHRGNFFEKESTYNGAAISY